MFEKFETERLIIRRLRLEDVKEVYEGWGNDPQVTQYLSWGVHQSIEDTLSFLKRADDAWKQGSGHLPFGLESKETGKLIGGIGYGIEARCRVQVGYALKRTAWGQGFASEALTGLIGQIWQSFPEVHRISGMCHATHHASAGVMLKVGMEKEGVLKRYFILPNISLTIPCDMAVYALTKT
ncbi:MAG: GNAT family N-acetyltransferase [Bacteroidia bacterium]